MEYAQYRELDSSGVSWLQKKPRHWRIKRLKFSADLINNKVSVDDSPLPYLGLEHIESWTGRKIDGEINNSAGLASSFVAGDVLFGKLRPYLAKVHLAQQAGLISSEALVVRSKEELHHEFLKYYMLSRDFINIVDSSTYGSKMPRASWDFIGNLPVLLPEVEEQQVIARFLDFKTTQIDALIAKQKALLGKLAEKRTALISHAVTKGLDPSVPMKYSGVAWLGKIPTHWKRMLMVRIISKFEQGWSPACEERQASLDEWGVLKSGCVNYGVFQEREHKTLPPSIEPIPSLEVKEGDILMCRASGSRHLIGSAAMVRKCRSKLMFSDKTYRIALQSDTIDPEFFVFLMKSKYIRDQIELSISGADGLANNIPQSSVKGYQIVLPPTIIEQKAILTLLNKKIESIEAQEKKIFEVIGRLQEYRSTLITSAVTGKIDVRSIEIPQAAKGMVL
jgi:type I restriction enzyme S subunit